MPARAPTLDTLQIALELLKRIPRQSKISAPELHRQLADAGWDRDLRTVQRLLEELSEVFDIERDARSRPYGYQWKRQARGLSLPGLTEHEALLLTLAQEHLRNLLPARIARAMEPFFDQARSQLSTRDSGAPKQAREWLDKVRVVSTSQPLLPPAIRPGIFEAVSEALYANRWLDVDYRNAANKRVRARLMPLGLAQQGPRLYLVARFEGFDNERSLALNRMHSAQATQFSFERPPSFDLAKYDNDGRFGFGEGKSIKLVIRIAKPAGLHLLESPLSSDQVHREDSMHYVIAASVKQTEQLKWWLRGFASEVEVISPKSLRDSL